MRTQKPTRLNVIDSRRHELAQSKVKGISVLATAAAVGLDTKRDYGRRLARFKEYCLTEDIAVSFENMDILDDALTEYFDHAYLEEHHDVDTGSKLIAAIQDAFPKLARAHNRGLLPVSYRALQGWGRLHPPGIGETLPIEGVAGICTEMIKSKLDECALMTTLAADTFLRPGVVASLRCEDIIPGSTRIRSFGHASILLHPFSRGVPSKQGKFNLSVVLDHPKRQWLTKLLLTHRANRIAQCGASAPLFHTTMTVWRRHFLQVADGLGISIRTLYCLRHAGASDCFLSQARTLAEIKRRGHWENDRSVKRYEQAAASRAMVNGWTLRLREHLELCHEHWQQIMTKQILAPRFTRAKKV